MTLKDLLLQFAGENESSLKLDELIFSNIEKISIQKDFNNGVEVLINDDVNADEIVSKIDKLLIKNKYNSYEITKIDENIIRIELT